MKSAPVDSPDGAGVGLIPAGGGHNPCVDPERYGELTDEFEQMASPERMPGNGSVIVCGNIDDLLAEMVKYLVTRN